MKPRPDPAPLLAKAIELNERLSALEKAEPGFKPEKVKDAEEHFVTETGGQTRTAHFSTNGATIETEDAKPKRAKDDKKVNLEALNTRMNPHAGSGVEREDAEGEVKKANPRATLREKGEQGGNVLCGSCGGSPRTGCLLHEGMDIHVCDQFKPL